MAGALVTVLLQMFDWFWQWNEFENRSIFDEVKAYKTKCASFWATLYIVELEAKTLTLCSLKKLQRNYKEDTYGYKYCFITKIKSAV